MNEYIPILEIVIFIIYLNKYFIFNSDKYTYKLYVYII